MENALWAGAAVGTAVDCISTNTTSTEYITWKTITQRDITTHTEVGQFKISPWMTTFVVCIAFQTIVGNSLVIVSFVIDR